MAFVGAGVKGIRSYPLLYALLALQPRLLKRFYVQLRHLHCIPSAKQPLGNSVSRGDTTLEMTLKVFQQSLEVVAIVKEP
jgi:hypothetical protein